MNQLETLSRTIRKTVLTGRQIGFLSGTGLTCENRHSRGLLGQFTRTGFLSGTGQDKTPFVLVKLSGTVSGQSGHRLKRVSAGPPYRGTGCPEPEPTGKRRAFDE